MSAESRKPSPGPWYAVAHPDESCSAISISLNRNDFAGGIATVYLNAIPNAELIIQAPALAAELAKLRDALERIDRAWEATSGLDMPALRSPLYDAMNDAKTLLAKGRPG